jgi:hypothetical protein
MGVGVGCSVETKYNENTHISIDFDEVRCISLLKKCKLGLVKCM